MEYQQTYAKQLVKGDRVYYKNGLWEVVNYYGHDVQVRKVDGDTHEHNLVLGNCLVRKVEST